MNEPLPPSDALLWEALPDLTLNIAQTADLCGISVRQLGYWTQQGYVTASGRGARRTYGLAAVRRVLAISKTMDGGASLRQALRQVGAEEAAMPLSASASSPVVQPAMSQETVDTLSRALRGFFAANSHTRDSAAGLAVKMGRAEEDIRVAAEYLCKGGVLLKSVCQGMTVFRQSGQGAAHV